MEITFEPSLIDLGEVKRGEVREMVFNFRNTGTMDFMIEIVSSCNCTTVEWPVAEVFKPGDSGQIDVDVILRENDPKTGYPAIFTPQFKFILTE